MAEDAQRLEPGEVAHLLPSRVEIATGQHDAFAMVSICCAWDLWLRRGEPRQN
jgi:hypothetical protein